jgi:predicted membrane-bound mannosyltransferase
MTTADLKKMLASAKMNKGVPKVIDHGGERITTGNGAVRESPAGKGRFDLIPAHAHLRLAQHFEAGARKYSDDNWRKGIPLPRYADSLERHLNAFKSGDRTEDHMAAVIWNAYCYLETELMIQRGELPGDLAGTNWKPSVP